MTPPPASPLHAPIPLGEAGRGGSLLPDKKPLPPLLRVGAHVHAIRCGRPESGSGQVFPSNDTCILEEGEGRTDQIGPLGSGATSAGFC